MLMSRGLVKRLEKKLARCTRCGQTAVCCTLVSPKNWAYFCEEHSEGAEKRAYEIGERLAREKDKGNPHGMYWVGG